MLPVLAQQNVHFRRLVHPGGVVGHLGLLRAADRAGLIRLVADGAAGRADVFVLAEQVRFLNPEVLSHISAFHAGSRDSIGDAAEMSSIAVSYSVRYGRTASLPMMIGMRSCVSIMEAFASRVRMAKRCLPSMIL